MLTAKTDNNSNILLLNGKLKLCRRSIEELNWKATRTQTDLSYGINNLTSSLKDKKVESISLIDESEKLKYLLGC